ncbi:MAG TPA: hypothetical protein ENJ09_15005 [Planctomycetes bacterium]|nr:hypothetical protein [Planctomycetota bacterium]
MASDEPNLPDEEDLPEGEEGLEEALPPDLEVLEGLADLEEDDVDGEAPAKPEEPEEKILFAKHKAPSEKAIREALDWAFEGEDVEARFLERCTEHALLLYGAVRRMNLTKIIEPREVAAKHYLDCWRATRLLPLLGKRVLDIGTGGGFPGIPIALAEENAHVHLIDADENKAAFVAECIEKMKIANASSSAGRGEEHLLRNKFDVCIMRDMSSVRENVRLLRKVRHQFYDLVMLKGSSWSREVRAGEREAERLGFRLDTILEHELPGEMGGRAVLVYRAPGGRGR